MDNHGKEIVRVLEYLRDNRESENVQRGAMIMRIKLSMEEEYLDKILSVLVNARAIEMFSHLGSYKFHLSELDSDIYNYYKITERGKRQLSRGTWTKPIKKPKVPKVPLTKEEKLERKKIRRDNMRHWWLIVTIVVATISLVTWILDFFFNFNIWKFIKSSM